MKIYKKPAVIALCSIVLVAMAATVQAEPVRQRQQAAQHAANPEGTVRTDFDPVVSDAREHATAKRRAGRRQASAATAAMPTLFGSSSLVAEAKRYLGTNPTGRRSLWCGAFMDLVLRRSGHRGGGNLARAYASYGTRVSGPQVGAIAVIARKGGGHVGVVSGVDSNGNPIVISGNHNNTVAESVYPRSRIIAYVIP